ncbi:transcriptional regulator with XRE-family HTH domain [Actinoplanes lutulentus]|uniref:Helix-turn-helix protein n=1 Tax=Actinoplanes lutulentus TaxID=1287878 RepID=A0A327YX39_9ACTN|nr:helix-turn-helix transcriptional regulator [Actinoplanes lutulentus]MBB2943504.1 transcriptional regulator with XRE-family HTH domain [Actinoplanes lutulentus]RAK25977.1 helix-turn-helix protein [Actinoplanes lutulentus]
MELRDFLTSRRAALSPYEVGLPNPAAPRRVKGLRREEVAILAGVSVDYYVKLEQGRVGNVSEQVLDAVARALRLDEVESRYLRSLLHPAPAAATVKARPALLSMIHAMDVPAVIHGPYLEILGVNHAGKALLDDYDAMPAGDRNTARWMFLNPRARIVYRDWAEIAADVVAVLRAAPVSEALSGIVGDLSTRSDEFARMWADYRVSEHRYGVKRFFHEAVGEMRLNWQTLQVADGHGQNIVVYSADTGSPSQEKLRLLTSWAAPALRGTPSQVDE